MKQRHVTSDSYQEILSLIQSDGFQQTGEKISYEGLGKLFRAYKQLQYLLHTTSNPYEYQLISDTIGLCFRLIAESYHLTQWITEEMYMDDDMILHDSLFVGTTIERSLVYKYWISNENEQGILSLFKSKGVADGPRMVEKAYPLLETLCKAGSNKTPRAMFAKGMQSTLCRDIVKSLEKSWMSSMEQYWSMDDAVRDRYPPAQNQTFHGNLVLAGIYRDAAMPKWLPSRQKGVRKAVQKKKKGSAQGVRGSTLSFAVNRLYCRLAISLNAEESSHHAALVVGPDGCGKATVCKAVSSILGASCIDLNDSLISLQSEVGKDSFYSLLQECIQSEFKRAITQSPCIILIRQSERLFITSSKRDGECENSKMLRAIKPYLLEEIGQLSKNSNVFILGTSSRPDDCVGDDREAFISFFNSDVISMTHVDHYSRMSRMVMDLQKYKMHHMPWPILSELASLYPEASWKDIDNAIKVSFESKSSENWQDLLREIHTSLKLELASTLTHESRQSRMLDIEKWVQDNATLFYPFTNIHM